MTSEGLFACFEVTTQGCTCLCLSPRLLTLDALPCTQVVIAICDRSTKTIFASEIIIRTRCGSCAFSAAGPWRWNGVLLANRAPIINSIESFILYLYPRKTYKFCSRGLRCCCKFTVRRPSNGKTVLWRHINCSNGYYSKRHIQFNHWTHTRSNWVQHVCRPIIMRNWYQPPRYDDFIAWQH